MLQAVWFGMPTARIPFSVGDCVDVLFQLNINEYQNTRSLQLILQDVRESESYRDICEKQRERFEEIENGGEIYDSEEVVPTREDIARVYTLLRHDVRMGSHTFSQKDLLSRVNADADRFRTVEDDRSTDRIGYVKMKFILRILGELNICSVDEPGDGIYVIDVNFGAPKTSIESSSLLHRLRAQRQHGGSHA